MNHVNTSVVRALMELRGISQDTLCTLAHVSSTDMTQWLHDIGDDSGDKVSFETQLEILKFLGIHGETPRPDVVHYWRVNEPFFSRAEKNYHALGIMLRAFGKAQVSYLAREADPALTFSAKGCFALKFASFQAILEVTVHPLRSISFNPESMNDLEWAPESMGVLLPEAEYDALEPGAMKVKGLTQLITYTAEMAQWDRLREVAHERGIRAQEVANALFITSGSSAALTEPVAARQLAPEAPVAVQAAPAAPASGSVIHAAAPVVAAPIAPPVAPPVPPAPPAPAPLQPDELRLFVRPSVSGSAKPALRAVG